MCCSWQGSGKVYAIGTWFAQILRYSGDNLTCKSKAGDGGTFPFGQSSALRLQIFSVTLANPFPPDSGLDLKNWDYGTGTLQNTFRFKDGNLLELDFTYFLL